MKPNRFIGILLGMLMVFFGISAYFSGEPASQTTQGKFMIVAVVIFGFAMFIGNASKPRSAVNVPQTIKPTCIKCNRELSPEFHVCPYCGEQVK